MTTYHLDGRRLIPGSKIWHKILGVKFEVWDDAIAFAISKSPELYAWGDKLVQTESEKKLNKENENLRDQFAMAAMHIVTQKVMHNLNKDFGSNWIFDSDTFESIASQSYLMADEMMQARDEK